jgi:hypothetical protein
MHRVKKYRTAVNPDSINPCNFLLSLQPKSRYLFFPICPGTMGIGPEYYSLFHFIYRRLTALRGLKGGFAGLKKEKFTSKATL